MADISRLPGPNADIWDWQLRGACRGEDPDTFFHPEGERGPAREFATWHFEADGLPFDLVVLPRQAERQGPLDPLDDAPMARANRTALARLLAGQP